MIISPIRDLDHNQDSPLETTPGGTGRGRVAPGDLGPEPGHKRSDLSFRRLRLRDLRYLVSSLHQEHLDQPDALLTSTGPLGAGLHTMQPFVRNRPATNLAFLGDQFAGYIQFDERGPDRRWVATNVGLVSRLLDDRLVLDGLLEFSVTRAGMRSVKRLFARVAPSNVLHDAFLACGFEPYMDESIHLLGQVGTRTAATSAVREQDPADTWAVHQLYHAAVPKHVQYAEAWTSHRWDAGAKRASKARRAFVMEDGYQVIAYAGLRCSGGAAVMEIMYLPDRSSCVSPFLRTVLGRVAAGIGPTRIYATARGFQQELKSALDDEGFQYLGEQQLLIKYTTAKVSARAVNSSIPLPTDVRERVPKQIPTYLNRPVREETPV